ncbi:arylsulfatase [Ferruginibacter sp. SUN106]|uniref:arylsulfatase n=1 Tax=Ferruginibacter sp. SUN106 TaxID=2978348 RepID=UPI003D35ADC2
MLKIFTAILLLTALTTTAQKKSPSPNIIFILADDLGYADIGCYGQQKTETPNLDKLAKEGMRFTQFYSGSTVCAPARTTLMTGLHTGHTPIRGNKTFTPEGQTPLEDNVITIANLLQKNGYRTGAFGKWSLGFITTSGDPAKKGFDEFFGYNCQSLAHDYYPDHLWHNHDRIDFTANLTANAVYSADTIHAEAMQFINQQNSNQPFFLYLPYTLPHGDVILPHDSVYNYYIRKFNEIPVPLGNKKDTLAYEPYPHAAFAAMVSRLDKYVGEIVNTINKNGLAENTLIIFCSDNGPHKENGGDPEFFQNHGIYRGIKRDLYEGGIRVPFIAYWKGKIPPAVTDQWLALWDMYPTFQQVAGLPVNKKVDGVSILPTLLHQGKQVQHDYLYWEFHENNGRQALRWRDWKLVKLNVNTAATTVVELYDLKYDPGEKNDIADKFPGIVKKLNAMIKKVHTPNKDWPLLPEELAGKKMVND